MKRLIELAIALIAIILTGCATGTPEATPIDPSKSILVDAHPQGSGLIEVCIDDMGTEAHLTFYLFTNSINAFTPTGSGICALIEVEGSDADVLTQLDIILANTSNLGIVPDRVKYLTYGIVSDSPGLSVDKVLLFDNR